jgi:heptosyltransferase-2
MSSTAATTSLSAAPPERAAGERVLVVANGFLGDTVLSIPFLRNLRHQFPAATIDVLVESAGAAVLAHCPHVDRVMVRRRHKREGSPPAGLLQGIATEARWLRSRGYTRAYLLKRSFSSALLVRLAGIPTRVGHASEGRGWLLSRAVRERRGRHRADTCLDLLREDGFSVDDGRPENWVTEDDAAAIAPLVDRAGPGRPRVFLAICSTASAKHWPADRWAAVADRLVSDRGCEIFLCGGPDDGSRHGELLERLAPATAAHVHDLSEAVPLGRLAALLARMDLCVGVDTGLPHIAASLGVPVAVLFGPTDPNEWHPWQSAGEVIRAERGGRATCRSPREGQRWPSRPCSMRDIEVADVLASAERLLADAAIATNSLSH